MIAQARLLPLLLLLLAGCVVGPNYHPPQTASPAQWASPLEGGETNLPAADARWWSAFHDAELDSLIVRAGESNLNLRAAWARLREARAAVRLASGALGPSLDTSASYSESRYPANGFPQYPPGIPLQENVYQAGFDAAWELDVFGGARRNLEAARANAAAVEFARRALLLSVRAETARNYIDARAFQSRLDVVRQNLQAQQNALALTRDLYAKGLTSELDVKQATALVAVTAASQPAYEAGFRQSAYRLAVLLGQPPAALLDELSPSPIPASPPVVPVGLPANLLQRRPDIRQSERQLAAATARIGVAVADLFPKFSLTGDVGLQSISLSDWFSAGSRFWSVGPTVQWRLFDSGQIRANIRIQNARQEQALADYEQTVLGAFEEVESALTAYAKEQLRRESLLAAVDANRQAVALAEQLYRNGLTDYLRVLVAQRSFYESQDAAIVSQQAVALDLISLYKALGGGW
jgi:NodT family efflux transporter outer membrane factor (OMF) lipoprotein